MSGQYTSIINGDDLVIDSVNIAVMIIGLACLFAGIGGKVIMPIPGGNKIVGSLGAILVLMAAASMLEWF